MSIETRRALIEKLEVLRGSKIICYITSTRQGASGNISDEAVREFVDHLQGLPSEPLSAIELFLVSNGGDGTVPWRLVPIFREYAKKFNVLIPFRAYSAATIMALGANEIVMHRFGALGPIDPTVTNEFNPIDLPSNRRLGISVEDVKAYISFIKETVGIRHEEELIKAVEVLINKVHPLALGNVERFFSQSRMIARKLLSLHTHKDQEHTLDAIIEALASKLYFHGHPINRTEAKELGLKIAADVPVEVETTMWDLFCDFEADLKMRDIFEPVGNLFAAAPINAGTFGAHTEVGRHEERITWAMIESVNLSSRFESTTRYTLKSDPQLQQSVATTSWDQGWYQTKAPKSP